jgi:polysaccharide deacetylase family protein (PEP-CTERM system associated)
LGNLGIFGISSVLHHILLTVDVEDWFQVENLKPWIPFSSWDSRELRVEKNTHQLLDLFDEARVQGSSVLGSSLSASEPLGSDTKSSQSCKSCLDSSSLRATFFVQGWIAERLPHLVREIRARGHEVASHGYRHELCSQCPAGSLKEDLVKSRKLLEDIIGDRVYGYRAPNFSISDAVLRVIARAGYRYDSSYNSFGSHGRYGKISTGGGTKKGIAHLMSKDFYELPISNLTVVNKTFPFGGGAYFRLMPAALFRLGVRKILDQQGAYLFYVHPWELDPEQPRVKEASAGSRLKHYSNLGRTEQRLKQLIERFSACRFVTCTDYLENIVTSDK